MQSTLPYVTTRAVEVIEHLFEAAGSSAIAEFNLMQRYWRDGHTARLRRAPTTTWACSISDAS